MVHPDRKTGGRNSKDDLKRLVLHNVKFISSLFVRVQVLLSAEPENWEFGLGIGTGTEDWDWGLG